MIKTMKDFGKKDSKKEPKKAEKVEKAKEASTESPKSKGSKGKVYFFAPFAPPKGDCNIGVSFEYEVNGETVKKELQLKIKNQQYVYDPKDCGGKEHKSLLFAALRKGGLTEHYEKPTDYKPSIYKIRHADFVNKTPNNYTGKSSVQTPRSDQPETINWKNGFTETKDEAIRDCLVALGHYDMTTDSLEIALPASEVIINNGKGAYTK